MQTRDSSEEFAQGLYRIICRSDLRGRIRAECQLTLVRYIHLNPIRAKIVHRPADYLYTGHKHYAVKRPREILEARKYWQ
jgi:hypothetical protein